MATTDNAYQSYHTGLQIDEAIDEILDGSIWQAAKEAKQAAQQAGDHAEAADIAAGNAQESEGNAERYASDAQSAAEEAVSAKDEAELAATRGPKIGENGNWMVWDTVSGDYKDSGVKAKGEKGPQGDPGVLVDLETGVFAMGISPDGHLLVAVNTEEEAPPLEIDQSTGHLIYKITT